MNPDGGQQPTVPELLQGVWRREWIRHADGTEDTETIVVWLQLDRLMADIRVPSTHGELINRSGLADCDREDLLRLLDGESSSGYTTCTPVKTDESGVRTATAEWFCRVDNTAGGEVIGVGFQPVSAYPEPGLVEWNDDGTVMIERAPSGDYVEEWRLEPGTRDGLRHVVVDERTELFFAGDMVIRVVDRPVPPTRTARLSELATDADDNTLRELANCEFSLAERDQQSGRPVITTSTLPWLIGTEIGVE